MGWFEVPDSCGPVQVLPAAPRVARPVGYPKYRAFRNMSERFTPQMDGSVLYIYMYTYIYIYICVYMYMYIYICITNVETNFLQVHWCTIFGGLPRECLTQIPKNPANPFARPQKPPRDLPGSAWPSEFGNVIWVCRKIIGIMISKTNNHSLYWEYNWDNNRVYSQW